MALSIRAISSAGALDFVSPELMRDRLQINHAVAAI